MQRRSQLQSFFLLERPLDSAQAANKEKTREILLTLRVKSLVRTVVKVQPRDAKIWRNTPDKPKKVNWWIDQQHLVRSELFWELRYDPDKGGGTENYFGDVDIECGETAIKVQPDKKPDFPYAQWPYSVTVYACVDGTKGEKLAESIRGSSGTTNGSRPPRGPENPVDRGGTETRPPGGSALSTRRARSPS